MHELHGHQKRVDHKNQPYLLTLFPEMLMQMSLLSLLRLNHQMPVMNLKMLSDINWTLDNLMKLPSGKYQSQLLWTFLLLRSKTPSQRASEHVDEENTWQTRKKIIEYKYLKMIKMCHIHWRHQEVQVYCNYIQEFWVTQGDIFSSSCLKMAFVTEAPCSHLWPRNESSFKVT